MKSRLVRFLVNTGLSSFISTRPIAVSFSKWEGINGAQEPAFRFDIISERPPQIDRLLDVEVR
jgi:hypothetical protein